MDQIPRPGADDFPRASAYDFEWMLENAMGPNAVWLVESLSQVLDLPPGARVLDLGCGRATSSIFLAREFDLRVWATDLWISAADNWQRVRAAGLQERVFPIHAEAHALPFAPEFFDALVNFDAYHYVGTGDLYLGYAASFVRPGGLLGIVVPGLTRELDGDLPPHLAEQWPWEWWSFHSPAWWRWHWEKTGLVDVDVADMIPNGWRHWLAWAEVCLERGLPSSQVEVDLLRRDAGRTLGFTRVVARKR